MSLRVYLYALILLISCSGPDKKPGNASPTAHSDSSGLSFIKLPPGFSISVFANVPDARSLCLGARGTLFVGNRSGDQVFAVRDENQDGVADKVYTIASGLNMPNGVAFKDGNLYIAEVNRILRLDGIEDRLSNPPKPFVVYDKLPTDASHGWKFIAFGPDGKLYIPVGAPCNICESADPVYAALSRMNPDGTGFEVFAKGIRNTVGFAWHPQTKQLWFTDNGRDNLGDNIPSDELNIAPHAGMHFGYPFCHEGSIPDPEFGKNKSCSDYTPPVLKLGAHVAALGIRFYTGSQFPESYKNQLFIAQHGSWNRSTPVGYRIMLVNIKDGKPSGYTAFAEGWLQSDGKALGRPVDVQVAPDGSLYVSDDLKGVVYRISYKG